MKPAPFKYHAPDTVDEAVGLLADYGYDAKILAGGQSLVATMNFRLAQPAVLIDLNNIPALSYIQPTRDGGVRVGAMTRQAQVERSALVAEAAPLLRETMPLIAHPQIRNRGTVGGSIAHADPASELPALLVTLRGKVLARSARGERWLDADDFFLGIFTTALEPDEILAEVRFPAMPARSGWAVDEVARRHGDFALVGAAALVELDNGGVCREARLVYFGVGDGPVIARQAIVHLSGKTPTPEAIDEAARIASETDIDPDGDMHATPEFRRRLANVLGRKVLYKAFARAAGEEM